MAIIRYISPYKKKAEKDPSPVLLYLRELDNARCERALKKYKENLKKQKSTG